MVVDSYNFLQIATVTSHFPTSMVIKKTWLPRLLSVLSTMADRSSERVSSVSSAGSTSLEAVASTSNASVDNLVVSHRS